MKIIIIMKMTVQYAKLVSGVALHMPYALAVKKESIYLMQPRTKITIIQLKIVLSVIRESILQRQEQQVAHHAKRENTWRIVV